MPGYRVHVVGGLGAWLVAVGIHYTTAYASVSPWYGLCALLGSLLPDLDTKGKLSRVWILWSVCAGTASLYLKKYDYSAALAGLWLFFSWVPHRGVFHTYTAQGCVAGIIAYLCAYAGWCSPIQAAYVGLYVFLGACSHLMLDSW